MATHSSDCTREGCHYAASGSASGWTSSAKFYSGKDGTWYRSRVTFKTGSFVGVSQSDKRFVMELKIDSTASPCGCMATLTTKSLKPGKIMNDSANGPHADLTAGCIGQSYAYEDSAASSYSTGTNKKSGYKFYFSFSSASIKPNTTYYVYCHYKSGRGSGTGWTRCNASALSAWVEYTPNWRLTCNTSANVASFTGGGNYAHNTTASTTATSYPGYHLTKYNGTNVSGGTQDWTISGSPSSHKDSWTMTLNRTATVYAGVNSYTYTFNANGGSVSPTTKSVTFGTTATGLPTPTRDGYNFTGWYVTLNGAKNNWFNLGRNFMWEDKFSFHMEAYADSWSSFASSSVVLASCTEGGGWEIYTSGSNMVALIYDKGVGYKDAIVGASLSSLGSGWHSFDLIFNGTKADFYIDGVLKGSTSNFSSGKVGYYTNNALILGAESGSGLASPAGSWFTGKIRNVVINHNTTRVTNAKNSFAVPAENLTLTADWSLKNYPITYNANGGNSTPARHNKTHGTALTLRGAIEHDPNAKTVVTTFDGNEGTVVGSTTVSSTAIQEYSFAGWKATDGTVYSAGGSYTKNESTTMTAQWSTSPYVGEAAIVLPTATRVGYTFNGWYTAPTGGTRVTTYYPNSDATLYAQWTVNYYEFFILDYYGNPTYDTNLPFNSSITLPAISETPVLVEWDSFNIDFTHYENGVLCLIDNPTAVVYKELTPTMRYIIEYWPDDADEPINEIYNPGDTFILPSAHVSCYIEYEENGFITEFRAPKWESWYALEDNDGKPLAYQKFNSWHAAFADGYWPKNVPAGAYITHKTSVQQGYLKSIQYESTFVPANGVLAFHKANGTYKLGIPMIKATNYNNANAYWIKAEDRWMTLQEYKDTQE